MRATQRTAIVFGANFVLRREPTPPELKRSLIGTRATR